jgi:hypothetical protein
MKGMGTAFSALPLVKFGGKPFSIAIKTRRTLAERNAMRIGKGDEAIGVAVEKRLAEAVMVFTALARHINEDGATETNRLKAKFLPRVILFIEFSGILRDILNAGISHRTNDIETIRPKPFKDAGSIARLALIKASKIRHPFGRGQINAKKDKMVMRTMGAPTVLTASEIANLKGRKAVITGHITKTLDEVLNIQLFKMSGTMLIVIGKCHKSANGMLEGFKAHTRNPVSTAFLQTNWALSTRNEHRGQMRFHEIARLFEGEDALAFGRQTASIICDPGVETVHDVMV